MAAVVQHQHHVKALTPTWFLVNVTPPPAAREGGKKALPAAYSPLLLSPAGWQRAQQDEKKRNKDDDADGGGLPASPRITCMGQVKGRRRSRGCSSERGPPPPPRDSRYRGAGGKVANLVLGLFGMRRNARTTSRACAKVRDVPRAGTASEPGSTTRGVRRGVAVAVVGVFDPPLPVVRRPATEDNASSLWERRRGGRALEGLQLMT
jgi:hypothetical protein